MWKTVKDFEKYQISDSGEIKTLYTRHDKIEPKLTNHGVMYISLYKNGKYTTRSFAKLVLETFTGKTGKYAIHKDGNPCNNKLENLEWSEVKPPTYAIKVFCRELNKQFNSLTEIVKETGLTKTEVIYSCETGKTVKGYTLFYISKPSKNKLFKRKYVDDLPNEEWKILDGSNERYMISNKGRIKSISKNISAKNGIIQHFNERIVQQRLVDGRATVQVYIDKGKRRFFTVPNEVFKHFINLNNKKRVWQIDQNPLNNAVDNLYTEV